MEKREKASGEVLFWVMWCVVALMLVGFGVWFKVKENQWRAAEVVRQLDAREKAGELWRPEVKRGYGSGTAR